MDVEAIAQDLWLREHERGRRLFYVEIRNYCYDKLRSERSRVRSELAAAKVHAAKIDKVILADEALNVLMDFAAVSAIERMVLYKHFYLSHTDVKIASDFDLSTAQISQIRTDALKKLQHAALSIFQQSDRTED